MNLSSFFPWSAVWKLWKFLNLILSIIIPISFHHREKRVFLKKFFLLIFPKKKKLKSALDMWEKKVMGKIFVILVILFTRCNFVGTHSHTHCRNLLFSGFKWPITLGTMKITDVLLSLGPHNYFHLKQEVWMSPKKIGFLDWVSSIDIHEFLYF